MIWCDKWDISGSWMFTLDDQIEHATWSEGAAPPELQQSHVLPEIVGCCALNRKSKTLAEHYFKGISIINKHVSKLHPWYLQIFCNGNANDSHMFIFKTVMKTAVSYDWKVKLWRVPAVLVLLVRQRPADPNLCKALYHLILELQTNHQQSFYNGG